MARCIGRALRFGCLTCHTEQTKFIWQYVDEHDQHKNTTFPSSCTNVDCPKPHVTYIPKNQSFAQVRDSQKCVVYLTPDGDYINPGTNDPNSEMVEVGRSVGVRVELGSIGELRAFQRRRMFEQEEKWQKDIDDGVYEESGLTPDFKQLRDALYDKSRNQVLEYDDKSLRENRHRLTEMYAEKKAVHQKTMEKFRNRAGEMMRVGKPGDNQRYDRLKKGR